MPFGAHMSSFLMSIPGAQLLDPIECIWSTLFDAAELFSNVMLCQLTLPRVVRRNSSWPVTSPTLGITYVFHFSHSGSGCNLHF